MKHVQKSVLLWYSPREMYALVSDVEDYPKFLPWCERVEVLERHDDGLTARLHLAYAGLRRCFTTRNVNVPDRSLELTLVDGPFTLLDGTWLFRPIGLPRAAEARPGATPAVEPGVGATPAVESQTGATPAVGSQTDATPAVGSQPGATTAAEASACKIEFSMRWAFARGPLEGLINPVFDRIANTFVDAFVHRAEQVYGAR